jgi:hypothetical protein
MRRVGIDHGGADWASACAGAYRATFGEVFMRGCATTLAAEMTDEEHALLLRAMGDGPRSGQHLEIGTAAGGTLCRMMGSFTDDNRPPFVVVDPMTYFPNQLEAVRRNLSEHGLSPDAVDFRVKTSAQAFEEASRNSERFDFILIDGIHKLLAVMQDLRWSRLLTVGGILCLHDYADAYRGVKYAVDRFLARNCNYQRLGLAGTLLAIRKDAPSGAPEIGSSDWLFAARWYLPLQIARKLRRRRQPRAAAH